VSGSSQVSHPLCARLYAKQANGAESKGLADQRRTMLDGLAGSVVEIGAGNGLNFDHYPSSVTVVHAFEPDPYLRRLAVAAAAATPLSISVGEARAEELPLEDTSVDAAVASLVLCSVKDIDRAVCELHRVLRPGGELRFNEHVVSDHRVWRTLQRAADATLWPAVSGGCHLARDTRAALEEGGFEVEQVTRFGFRVSALDPPKSHLLGIARRV
jgi:ubiquinone/menaquinone biosynthesis C-methylase UbiE